MASPILHHYDGSLFSEKIRLLLGHLDLPWRSVITAPIMPRPDLMPLTGGYRKTPNLQIGADVISDTWLITRRLAELAGNDRLHAGFSNQRVAELADTELFRIVVAVCFQPRALAGGMARMSEAEMAAFAADRAELAGDAPIAAYSPALAEAALAGWLRDLESDLAGGSAWLGGDEPAICDFSVYHCLWLVAVNPAVADLLDAWPAVTQNGGARMAAIGHGEVTPMASGDALAEGRDAAPAWIAEHPPAAPTWLPDGIEPSAVVSVTPTDYGRIPVTGTLVACTTDEVVVERMDEAAGTIHNHFPRRGFEVVAPGRETRTE